MFSQILNNFQLTSPAADEIFPNCTGDNFRGDTSFLAILRAVVAPRMKEGDVLHLAVADVPSSSYEESADGAAIFNAISAAAPYLMGDNQIVVVNLGCRRDTSEKVMEKLDAVISQTFPGYTPSDFHATYFKKNASTDARFLMSEAKKSTIMIVANLSLIIWHLLATTICKTIPWFFVERPAKDDPEVSALLSAMVIEENPEKFKELIVGVEQKYDFRSAGIRNMLHGYEKKYDERALKNVRAQMNRCRDDIANYYQKAAEASRQLHNHQATEAGLLATIAAGGSDELMKYFLINQHLELESVDDDELVFSVGGYYLDMWDEDACELAIKNHRNSIYAYFKNETERKKAEKFFRACFQMDLLKIRVCAAYKICAYGECAALKNHAFPMRMQNCTPNPHAQYYRCLGGHEAVINQATNCGNYVAAVEQCCAAARNVNFNDSTVMETWSNKMFASDVKCIELPDGTSVTPKEGIEWAVENVK